ncbi:MAG: ATPase, partial [Planctomycetota bacterium]
MSGGRLAGPDEFGQGRVVAAFAALMTTLGSPERPTVLVLDNCQWMDDQSIRVLQRVSKSQSAYTLMLLSMRTDEAQAPKVRETCHAHSLLEMGPLDRDSVRRLCESMAGLLPERAVTVVQDYAEGSPFMASAVLRGMVESSVLVSRNRRWELSEDRLQHFQTAASAGAVLAGRLKNLPPMTRDFMNAAAVIGSEFTLDAVVELSTIDLEQSFELLADVRRQRMVWSKPDGSYAFVHDK